LTLSSGRNAAKNSAALTAWPVPSYSRNTAFARMFF